MRAGLTAFALSCIACLPATGFAQWYAATDFVPMGRYDTSSTVFQRMETAAVTNSSGVVTTPRMVGSSSALVASNLELPFTLAGRATVGARFGDGGFGIEGSYLLSDTWRSAAEVFDANALLASPFTPVGNQPNPLLDDNTAVTLSYRSVLQSVEAHFTQLVHSGADGEATLLAGIRAMSIDERLGYLSTNATQTNDILATTENRLIGPQFGVLARTPVPGGYLNARGKGAFLWNAIEDSITVNGVVESAHFAKGAALGEAGIDYCYYPTPNLAVKLGYQVLGLTDVGLATENLALTTASGIKTRAVFYHGPCFGLVLNY